MSYVDELGILSIQIAVDVLPFDAVKVAIFPARVGYKDPVNKAILIVHVNFAIIWFVDLRSINWFALKTDRTAVVIVAVIDECSVFALQEVLETFSCELARYSDSSICSYRLIKEWSMTIYSKMLVYLFEPPLKKIHDSYSKRNKYLQMPNILH